MVVPDIPPPDRKAEIDAATGPTDNAVASVGSKPLKISRQDVLEAQCKHPVTAKLLTCLTAGELAGVFDDVGETEKKQLEEELSWFYVAQDGLLMRHASKGHSYGRIVLPLELRQAVAQVESLSSQATSGLLAVEVVKAPQADLQS